MPTIDPPVRTEIRRFPDQSPAFVCSAHEGSIDQDDLLRIVEICSEPEIYETLFRRMLRGKPYTLGTAESFRDLCYSGWRTQESFVFLIRNNDNQLIGVMDIKSADDGAEIGYWASNTAPGYMTNAVSLMIKLAARAGYRSLSAVTLLTNIRSQRVLRRVGFEQTKIETQDRVECMFFKRSL